jgi:alkanesulfonate monooxygenase SsuD/methylene tetrahydromethanopterin reductase-like flavin-dependent oxidoreductase (luciferase family)
MLAAMAALTSRIRIGCQVTGMPYRHPAVLANMAATVDVISGGRLILGLGAAWNEMECTAYGIPLPPLKERFDRFDEGVEAITLLLSQTVANYSGRYVTLTDARCEPKPVQRPYPPITIGGNGRKRTLRTAAHWAAEWNSTLQDPAQYAELKGVLAGHCAAVGRDFSEITCSCLLRSDGEGDLGRLVDAIAQWRDAGADLAVIGLPLHAKPEFLSTLAGALAPLSSPAPPVSA